MFPERTRHGMEVPWPEKPQKISDQILLDSRVRVGVEDGRCGNH